MAASRYIRYMVRISSKDNSLIKDLRAQLPQSVQVSVTRSEDGGFVAAVTSIPGTTTEADTFSELIDMVNDAVLTALNVPEKLRSYFPVYLPPMNAAADLGVFPVRQKDEEMTLRLAVHGGTTR